VSLWGVGKGEMRVFLKGFVSLFVFMIYVFIIFVCIYSYKYYIIMPQKMAFD
jgi:hypothetical protein